MKYGKLMTILSATVAVAFLLLVFVAVFSVKDVNVDYCVYGERAEGVEEALSVFEGRNLLFISEAEIEEEIKKNAAVKVNGVRKVYPSSIYVSVSRRQERYALKSSDGEYYILDEEFAAVDKRGDTSNEADGLNNILVEFDVKTPPVATVNSYLDGEDVYVKAFETAIGCFLTPRDIIESVLVYETPEIGNVRITIRLRSGLEIVVYKALERTYEKTRAAIEKLDTLSDADKITGRIECLELAGGDISAVYTTR